MKPTTRTALSSATALGSTLSPKASVASGPMQALPMEAPSRKPRNVDERQTMEKRAAAIVADQLRKDIDASGALIACDNVYKDWRGFIVRMLQWHSYGVGKVVSHEFGYKVQLAEQIEEDHLRAATTSRFAKYLKTQKRFSDQFGEVKITSKDDFDLTILGIEKPIAAAILSVGPDGAEDYVREEIIETRGQVLWNDTARALKEAGIDEWHLEMNRLRLGGGFVIDLPDLRIIWSKGSVALLNGVTYPDSVLTTLRGKPLSAVFEHPLFDGTMTITSANPVRKGGRNGIVLNLKDFEVPMTEGLNISA